jgi:MFS family permease
VSDGAVHDPYAALRIPAYRRFVAAGVLSAFGQGILTIAVAWELWVRTRSAEYLAYTGLAQFLPVLLLALPAGQAADRYRREMLYRIAQSFAAVAAFSLAALSYLEGPVPLYFVCLALIGVARAITMPSRAALVSQIVPAAVLPNAVNWNSMGWQIANVLGPLIGGIVVAVFQPAAPAFVLAGFCSLGCVVLILGVRPPPIERGRFERSLGSLLAGLSYVFRTKLILAAITLDLFAVLLGGATALLPIFATDILHVGALGMSTLRWAPAIGAGLMAIYIAHRPPMRRPGVALLVAVAGFGAATIGFGLSTSFWLSFFMLALTGAFDNISVVVRGTLVQVTTPNEMRGRVSAVNSIFISSSNELGEYESGMVAHWFGGGAHGAVVSAVFGGVGTIVVVALAWWRWPILARIGPLHQLRPDTESVAIRAGQPMATIVATEELPITSEAIRPSPHSPDPTQTSH